ncbi:hypothetical protein L211DRAFT_791386 [Terfezia boudieri ATCC MYA-4762]|uniref:K Homology domain-containing protein n=1 Tax=Terfezia boudieri ATCC MYA-4762 TaxID=1051890 RepID=A0A3N4LHK2_9PEZI|nr:hypothetical protein L211DRAFT_791386 [Terfezia boudieri ATCC MYA-4762]
MEEHERAAAAAAAGNDASATAAATAPTAPIVTVDSNATTVVPAADATIKATEPKTNIPDVNSAEAFPALGGGPAPPKPATTARSLWGSKMPTVISAPGLAYTNGATTASKVGIKPTVQIWNEKTSILELQGHEKLPKNQLKRGMADIGKDVEKKTGTRIQMSTTSAGVTVVIVKGRPGDVSVARRELMRELCPRRTIAISIPTSVRPHIIGKRGEMIKRLQQETQTKINVPKMAEGETPLFEDDGTTIEITVEGDAEGTEICRRMIDVIVAEKTAHTVIRINDVHGKFYPFIAGPNFQTINDLQRGKDIKINVPEYFHTSTKKLSPASGPIIIRGEKNAANEAKLAIEEIVRNLAPTFTALDVQVLKNKHRFIYGDRGKGIHELLEKTGCSAILPADNVPVDLIVVTGPSEKIGNGISAVMSIVNSYIVIPMSLWMAHQNSPIGGEAHARALVRLWARTGELKPIESALEAEFVTPKNLGGQFNIDIIARSTEAANAARDQFKQLVARYTPGKIEVMKIDPLCHPTIIGKHGQGLKQILDKHGVQVLIGEDSSFGNEVFLVIEDPNVSLEECKEKFREVKELLEEQAKGLGDIVSERITIDGKFHKVIFDGSTFRALSQGTVSVNFTLVEKPEEGEEAGEIRIIVRGPAADVKNTIKRINAWVEECKDKEDPGEPFTLAFDYPAQFSPMLIGTKGANVNKLRDELGVDIKLKEGKGEIKGIQINVEVAQRRLNEQIKQLDDNTTLRIQVPPEHHRAIIGAQGKFVRRLEENYGVRINFPKSTGKEDLDNVDASSDAGVSHNTRQLAPNEVMIKGGKKGCAEAKSEIEELLKYEIEHGQTATLNIAAKSIKGLFTTYMKEFRRIREESGARIDIPNDRDAAPDTILEIRIKGTKEAVLDAKKDLSKIIDNLAQLVVERITVDKRFHRSLIGTGGATLRDIVEKAGGPKDRSAQARMVKFPNTDSQDDVIKIEGHKSVVEKIITSINQIVEGKKNQVQVVVDVPQDKHARLIGRGGSIRQDLEAQFKVTIDIPRQNSAPSAIGVTLTGPPEAVEKAKAHIIELTKEFEGETVMVPRALHHAVADGGLFIKRLRNDYRVSVDHGNQPFLTKPTAIFRPMATNTTLPLITDQDQDEVTSFSWEIIPNPTLDGSEEGAIPWILRSSSPDALAKAKDLLQKQIELVKTQSHVGFLTLPDQSTYRFVVGRNGQEVNKIKELTGCRVMVPKAGGGEGEAIVLWGAREGLEKAREVILEIVAGAEERGKGRGGEGEGGGRRGGYRGGFKGREEEAAANEPDW